MDYKEKNYYEILEIPTDASPEEVEQGYTRAKNAYSQDSLALYSLMTKEECDAIVELIDEAYTIISDPKKRKQYDEARGINHGLSYGDYQKTKVPKEKDTEEDFRKGAPPSGEKNMQKIVAVKRFALDYEIDSEMEKEIEQTTEFTGEFLKSIREYKNVDIPRMADMTKVSKTYLGYIEQEEYDKLPALVYVRGFVYQYAKCLKLNPDLVATSYLHRLKKLKEENG